MVLCNGKVTGIADSESVTKEDLGLMMAGESLSSLQRRMSNANYKASRSF